jgi:hypothetical protein
MKKTIFNLFRIFFTLLIAFSTSHMEAKSRKSKGCPHYLSICAIFQDEAPFLKEWLDFHIKQGVEHFYLYNNNSKDNYADVLSSYIHKGLVELTDWPSPPEQDWTPHQQQAYNHCMQRAIGQTCWLAVIDIDEFIVAKHSNLHSFLRKMECDSSIGGIFINWQCFGTSNLSAIPPGKLMTECLTWKAPWNHPWNSQGKTICKPQTVACFAVHGAHYHKGYKQARPDHKSSEKEPVQIKNIQINHYWTRTEQYFWNVKVPRRERLPDGKITHEALLDLINGFHAEEDYSIIRINNKN